MLIPNKHNGYTRDGVRRVFFDGGGGGGGVQKSEGVTYTSNVPEWLKGEQKDIVARGMALGQQPYQPYTGERVSQFTPLQRQAFSGAERQQIAPQLGLASGLATLGGVESFRDPGRAGSFMNPFIEQALAPQLQGLARQAQIEGTRQQGEATMRGAFGGSRDAIMRAEREKNLLSQQADVLGRGYAQAFDVAQGQFNAEQARRLGAAQALGGLGQQQFGQEMDITGRQQQFGTQQQQQIQRILDQQFADFQAQRDFPYQQIGFMSDLIQGRGGSTRSIYPVAQPSSAQMLAGLGTAAVGLGGLARAKGGSIPSSYAEGGITALLGDADLAKRQQTGSPMEQMVAAEEAQQRAMLRSAAPAEMPEMSDMTEEELLAALQSAIQQGDETKARVIAELIEERKMPESGIAMIAPESVGEVPEGGIMGMYGGGAVAFRTGNEVLSPYRLTPEEQMMLLQPDPEEESAAGRALRNLGGAAKRAFMYSSDAEALREQGRLPSASPLAAVPVAASGGGRGIEAGPTAEDLAQATRENPRMMAGLPALEKAPAADAAAGNVATPGGAGGLGAITPAGYRAQLKAAGYDIDAEQAAEKKALQDEFAARREAVAADRADLEKLIAQRGVYGEEREKEARASIEGLKGEKDQARSMALFQAGLAILSADPSRGAMAAIGEGALKGVGAYKGDLKELEAKRASMSEKLDRIVDIRRQERFADDEKRGALKKEENRLTADLARETRSTLQGFGKTNLSVATAAVKAASDEREAALNRADRRSNQLALQRLSLNQLRERRLTLTTLAKQAEAAGEMEQAAQYRQELADINTQLSGGGGGGGSAANMTGWGKAIVE